MEVYAILRNVPMSPQKMREVVRQIQGLPAQQAHAMLQVVPRKGARLVAKTLASALANAEHLRSEWNASKIQQEVKNLETQVENTHKRKRRNALRRRLSRFEDFLESRNHLAPESLRVKVSVAGSAMIIKRFMTRARGAGGPILKRRCHIKITLSDE